MTNPVLDASHVTGLGSITFIADPFVVKEGNTYYMFYEVLKADTTTTIVYSTSSDGLSWSFGGEVLSDANMEDP